MSAEHDDAVFDLDDDDESSQSQDDDDDLENDGVLVVEEDEEDLNSVPSPSTPSPASISAAASSLPIAVPSASIVTVAAAPNGAVDPHKLLPSDYSSAAAVLPDAVKRPRLTLVPVFEEQRKPTPQPLDKSRQLFQRLWTDEDEIELLQGFLEYSNQRGGGSHHDTALFYDQIKSKLQLDFNKNQLVEKLRRLKKKYRNVLNKIGSGKEFSFKTAHDQVTFEISRKIWSTTGKLASVEDGNLDDDEGNPNLNNNNDGGGGGGGGEDQKSTPRPRKRSRSRSLAAPLTLTACGGGVAATAGGGGGNLGGKVDDKRVNNDVSSNAHSNVNVNVPSLIEETVKSCLSPLFKELLSNAMAAPGASSGGRGIGGLAMNAFPLSFGGVEMMADEKWRKQQILELEVYSKRLELVQDQIRSQLEELRSVGR
ncbi:unnamed protein product [Linum tenue]|uniref:Glabrous enhancer-binding protein-like DBD domain-containing protein n=1 Tax=Linum tenue TaxID=586396 RepID=A0AAV0HG01_9ROSI|nr:unnamed protein product [Linum tenue]